MKTKPKPAVNPVLLSSEEYIKKSKLRIVFFRLMVFLCLMAAAALGGYFGFTVSYRLQDKIYHAHYNSITQQLQNLVLKEMENKVTAGKAFATVVGNYCPNDNLWPNCSVEATVYDDLTNSLVKLSKLYNVGLGPLITQKTRAGFEAYAYNFFLHDPSLPKTTGMTPIGKGIWTVNPQKTPPFIHDVYSPILLPAFQFTAMRNFPNMVMFNTHTHPIYAHPQDALILCAKSNGNACPATITDIMLSQLRTFTQPPVFAPASVIFQPIFPVNAPNKMVGIIGVRHDWGTSFDQTSIPNFVNLDCVINTSTVTLTYKIANGTMTMNNEEVGDFHDRNFDTYMYSFRMKSPAEDYTITFYPNKEYYDIYHSNAPIIVSAGAVLVMVITSAIFLLYDFFVKREAMEKQLILDAKRVFVRFISHEIRTPMNTVCLGLKLMQEELETINSMPEIKQHSNCVEMLTDYGKLIYEVKESSDAAILVLNDLINFDKIEMKTLAIEKKPILIWELISNTVKPLHVQVKQSDVNLMVNLEINTPNLKADHLENLQSLIIIGDSIKLGQVIRNVVSNAVKNSTSGKEIIFKATWDPNGLSEFTDYDTAIFLPSGSITIEVQDFGPGLSEEEQRELFQEGFPLKFNQGNAQGSGLGLWISKGIVDQHHGKISAFSPGLSKGSSIFIELPTVTPKVKIEPTNAIEETAKFDFKDTLNKTPSNTETKRVLGSESSKTKNKATLVNVKRVLVVDDTASNRKMVCRMLKREGFECVEAEDGQQCVDLMIETAPDQRFDIILLDFEMPRLDGPGAARKLRDLGFDVIIFGVTGNVLADDVDYFINHGANAVLHKPVNMEMIASAYAKLDLPQVTAAEFTALPV